MGALLGVLSVCAADGAGGVEAEFDQARHGDLNALLCKGSCFFVRTILHGTDHGVVTITGAFVGLFLAQYEAQQSPDLGVYAYLFARQPGGLGSGGKLHVEAALDASACCAVPGMRQLLQ
jgi:hypothetical protein